MAVDEALLRTAGESRQITLRLYQWEQPTLSLGYFQAYDGRQNHAASQPCPVVRRATGGGAIVHDREITYSLTAPVAHRLDQQLLSWYQHVHQAWRTTLATLGIEVYLCPRTDPQREEAFLCFERRSAGDLLLGGYKIGGSAQRRHRDAVLQHGSLLLDRSPAAPELPGIAQLVGPDWESRCWQPVWLAELSRIFEVSWAGGKLTDRECSLARKLDGDRFGCEKWTLRR